MLIKNLLIILIALSITLITIGMVINKAYADLNDGLLAYYPFDGDANDEVRIYNRALTEIEIPILAGWPTTISPASPDFGNIGIDCRSIQSFIMESLSDSDLEIGAISITGPNAYEFRIQNDNCSSGVLVSSETCTFEVVFEPGSSGEKNAILIIYFNTPDTKTIEIPLKGRSSEVCEGDFDNDGDVDGSDLSILASDFGRTDCCMPDVILCEGDFYGDCDVDGSDLVVFASDFGRINCPFCPIEICDDCILASSWTLGFYNGGDLVNHNGIVYECKPWPLSGLCGMGGAYEPGVGWAWEEAWIEKGTCEPPYGVSTCPDEDYAPATVVSHHGMSSDGYQTKFDEYKTKGYRLVYVDGFAVDDSVRFAAIWKREEGPKIRAHHNMTSSQYQQAFDEYKEDGYRLVHVDGYSKAGVPRFAAIWEKRPGVPMKAQHNLSSAQYQEAFDTNKALGYRLVHVSGYDNAGVARFAAIWEKTDGLPMKARHNMSSSQYQEAFDDYSAQGYRLKHVSTYNISAGARFAAIWVKRDGRFPARHNLSHTNYQNVFDNFKYQGHFLRRVTGYVRDDTVQYAGLWEYVGDDYSRNSIINSVVKNYVDNAFSNVTDPPPRTPGISIAITKDERLVYAGGYGYARNDEGIIASPKNLYRIASVSKPITASIILRLAQEGMFASFAKIPGAIDDLDSYAFGPDGILGYDWDDVDYSGYLGDITLRHLLEHTAGGWGRNDDFNSHQNPEMNHLQFIHDVFVNTGDVSSGKTWELDVPGDVFDYSNFGYIVLGRIIEEVTGENYEDYVREEIFTPIGIQKMQIGASEKALAEPTEAHYISIYDDALPYVFDLSRIDSAGGWIASPIDLVRFGVRVDGNNLKPDILNSASFTTMITPETNGGINESYAKGWDIRSTHFRHFGMMTGTRSTLIIFNDGIIVSVLTNWAGITQDDIFDIATTVHDSVTSWPTYDLFDA